MNKTDKPTSADIPPSQQATDVQTFVGELEAGLFESFLSAALSETAKNMVLYEKKKGGTVDVKLEFEHIEGTSQVRIGHSITFTRPTRMGKRSESYRGASVMHVGPNGRLTVTAPELPGMPQRQGSLDA